MSKRVEENGEHERKNWEGMEFYVLMQGGVKEDGGVHAKGMRDCTFSTTSSFKLEECY